MRGGVNEPGLQLASPGRRLAGFVLDAVLFVVTLGIGWLVWLLIVSGRGQSPSKQLLRMRVVHDDGLAAETGWMVTREIVLKVVFFAVLDRILEGIVGETGLWMSSLVFTVAALWCVWDKDRQCLWDKVARTRVVYAPRGTDAYIPAAMSKETMESLRTLADLHERGLLTDEQYKERRAREMERL